MVMVEAEELGEVLFIGRQWRFAGEIFSSGRLGSARAKLPLSRARV
jgi:hypothetical protein